MYIIVWFVVFNNTVSLAPLFNKCFYWLFDDLEFKTQNSFVKQGMQTQYGAVLIGISD